MIKNWTLYNGPLKSWVQNNRKTVMAAIVALAYGFLLLISQCQVRQPDDRGVRQPDIDTLIPRGYTLVPITVQNLEALDPIFGSHGIVDLYSGNERGGQLVATQVKMLRAPLNPSVFAVLVRTGSAKRIAGDPGPFFVVLHNRNAPAGDVETTAQPKRTTSLQIVEENAE